MPRSDPLEQVITPEEAADMLGVSRRRVRALLASGGLRGRQAGSYWLVARRSVEERLAQDPQPGRPRG